MSSSTGTHGVPPTDRPWVDELVLADLLIGFANVRRLWKAPGLGVTGLSKCSKGVMHTQATLWQKLIPASTIRNNYQQINYMNLRLYCRRLWRICI